MKVTTITAKMSASSQSSHIAFSPLVFLFPESPLHFCDIDVEVRLVEQPPPIADPYNPDRVRPRNRTEPICSHIFLKGQGDYFTELTIASNAFGLFIARSARTLRLGLHSVLRVYP